MDMIFHTAEEIISLGNVEKRWSIGYKELAHIIFSGSLTLFSCYDIRKVDGIVCFGGKETTFRQDGLSVYEKFDEEHEIDVEDYYNDFANGCYIGKDIEINFYLLTTQICKYETENPYLLGKKLEGQEAQEAFQQTAQADSPLSDLQPMLSPIGRQSEESDDARVAELEALARKRAARGLDTEQAEELEKVRKELEAEKVSHARTRKELEEKIERLEQQLAEKDKARGQGVDAAQAANIDRLELPRYGAIKFVDDCYRANMTPEQTAQKLWELGYKSPSISALLHPDDVGEREMSLSDQAQYGRDLRENRVKGKKAW